MRKRNLVPEHVKPLSGQAQFAAFLDSDFHETLAPFLGPIYNFAEQLWGRKIENRERQVLYHPGYDPFINLTPLEWAQTLRRFAAGANGGYGSLTPYPLAEAQLKAIAAARVGIGVMTWCPGPADISDDHEIPFTDGTAQGATLALLESLIAQNGWPIKQKDIRFVAPWMKAIEMQRLKRILVAEDCPYTIAHAASMGRIVLAVQRSYNESLRGPGIIPVRGDLADLADLVLALVEELRSYPLIFEN